MNRHWTVGVSSPFDLVKWTTTHIKLTNWKTGEVVYENNVEHPADWAQSAVEMCASKYFRKADVPGIGGEHSIKQLAFRVANCLAKHGVSAGYFDDNHAAIFRDEVIAGFITQRIGFNSPVWFNFGLYSEYGIKGSTGRDRFFVDAKSNLVQRLDHELIRPGGAACFLTKVTDSLFSEEGDGMFDWIATQTKVFLTGAGDGANVSDIRGVGEPIAGGGVSAGLPAFLPVRDQSSGYIKSGGKTRRSATMLVCDLDHPDIEWYINWKRHEEAKAHALIATGYDADYEGEAYGTVSGQNSNNSVRVSNAFMSALARDDDWYLLSRCDYRRFKDALPVDKDSVTHPQGEVLLANGQPVAVRKGGKTRKIMKVVKASALWNQIVESAWSCGCPGIHFEDTINLWNTMPHYGEIRTSNPCFSGDTMVPTSTGLVRIADWASEGDVRHLWSNERWIEAWAFPTKMAETITLRFSNGFEITCTPDHRFELVDGGEIIAKDALDQRIKLTAPEVGPVDEWDSNLVFQGLVQGDGLFHEASGYFKHVYIGKDDGDVKSFVESLGIELIPSKNQDSTYSLPISVGKGLCNTLKPVALPSRDLTDDILYLPPASMASFLRGLYSANGSVMAKHDRVTLKATCRNLALQVQQALLSLGIRSHVTTNKPTAVKFDNGTYECRESYDLNITSSDCVEFSNKVGFIQSYKNKELEKIVKKARFGRSLHPRVVEIVEGGVEQVYDFTLRAELEDDERWACVSGASAHNCSEVFQPDNTTCNLCSINLIKFFQDLRKPDWAGFKHAAQVVTIALDLVVDISSYPTPQHARGAWDIRSIGANHGNIGSVLMCNGIPYDSHEGRAVMSIITNALTYWCWQQSNMLALTLGSYPAYNKANHKEILLMHMEALEKDEMLARHKGLVGDFDLAEMIEGWRKLAEYDGFRNSNVTCLVPQGTIGLVLGQDTTGCEPDFALRKSKKCVGGTYMDFVNTSVGPALERLGYGEEQARLVKGYVMKYGAVENCPHLKEEHLPVFDASVRQKTCIDAIAYIVRDLEEEEAEFVFKAVGHENDPFKIKKALADARKDDEEWEELFEDLDVVSEVNELIKNCTSMDQVRRILAENEYDLYALLPCVQVFTRVISHNGHIDALGAFQPHISMGISKTINMNHDVSIGDVSNAYKRAYEKGCKCVAIYRDDSKKSQPLNTGTNRGIKAGKKVVPEKTLEAASFEEAISTYLSTPDGLKEALRRVIDNPELAALVPPTRRVPSLHTSAGDRFRFTLPHQGESIGVFIHFNCWEGTNDLMEVFIDLGKEGDTISGLIDSVARMISLSLQFGIPPQTIGDMLEGMNFGPHGFLGKSSVFGIRSVKSVPDLVGKLLKILPEYYALGRPEAMLHPKPYSPDDPAPNFEAIRQAGLIMKGNPSIGEKDKKPASLPKAVMPSPSTSGDITSPQEAKTRGFTGLACKKCGSLRTVGTTSCFQCLDCGEFNGPCG